MSVYIYIQVRLLFRSKEIVKSKEEEENRGSMFSSLMKAAVRELEA
jgi:hypothetical protein